VLAVGAPPELVPAVRSLAAQGTALEIVVVNSGGGNATALLAGAGLADACLVVESAPRLFPGAARNAGVARTQAPWISFLAADCLAEPGWAVERLRAHAAGDVAVASAVTNLHRRNLAAWASYMALFVLRMPGAAPERALRYGVSYSRALLEACGGFREDLRTGEDTELHQRLPAGTTIAWRPEVRTAHAHPRSLGALLRDQYRRGGRSAATWRALGGPSARTVAFRALGRLPSTVSAAWRAAAPSERWWIASATPLLPLAAGAYAAGALLSGSTDR
jgi:glycosyltransferase involved in cell wall biosynthesis